MALIIRGFALGLLFTPINIAAFSSLKGQEIPQGSSFVNLARQLGGSFGIAALKHLYHANVAVSPRQSRYEHLSRQSRFRCALSANHER